MKREERGGRMDVLILSGMRMEVGYEQNRRDDGGEIPCSPQITFSGNREVSLPDPVLCVFQRNQNRSAMAARRASSLFIRSLVHRSPLPLSPRLSTVVSTKTLTTTTSPSPWQPHHHHHHQCRCFCSSTSNIAYLKSDKEFTSSLAKVKDDRVPAIFYFTAAWCGPCRLLSPIIEDLSTKYPHVNIYKIDVDQKELEVTLSDLRISSVPTLHFFHEGKKATEIVGADVALLKKVMEDYYK